MHFGTRRPIRHMGASCFIVMGCTDLERRGHSRHFHEETPFTFAGLACFIPVDTRADGATGAAVAAAPGVATSINAAASSSVAVSVREG